MLACKEPGEQWHLPDNSNLKVETNADAAIAEAHKIESETAEMLVCSSGLPLEVAV